MNHFVKNEQMKHAPNRKAIKRGFIIEEDVQRKKVKKVDVEEEVQEVTRNGILKGLEDDGFEVGFPKVRLKDIGGIEKCFEVSF